jgi:hypothetical protein
MAAPRSRPLPGADTPLLGPDGISMNAVWYAYFQTQGLQQLSDVSNVAPTNNQVLVYNATTKMWVPGAN